MPARARRTSTKAKAQPAPEPEEIEDDIDDLEDEVEVDEEPEPAPVKKAPARRTRKAKAAPEPEPEADEDEDEDEPVEEDGDDDLEDDEDEAPAKTKRTPPKRKDIQFGTKWLAEYVNEKLGVDVTPYKLRDLIRKMVKADKFERNVGVDRDRYEFSGPKDAKVIAVLKEIKGGALEKKATGNADNLAKARAKRAENLAAAKKATKVEQDDVEELDDEDDDIEELDD